MAGGEEDIERREVTREMRRKIAQGVESDDNLLENISTMIDTFSDVAATFGDRNDVQMAHQVCEDVKALLVLKEKAFCHKQALEAFAHYYQCPPEEGSLTDFVDVFSSQMNTLMASRNYNVEDNEALRALVQDIQGQENGGGDDGGDGGGSGGGGDDDDDEIIDASREIAPNDNCPISMKPILQLEMPVEDAKGIVYEKAVIVALLREAEGNQKVCPLAGTTHIVRLQDLKTARRVIREQRRIHRATADDAAADDDDADDIL